MELESHQLGPGGGSFLAGWRNDYRSRLSSIGSDRGSLVRARSISSPGGGVEVDGRHPPRLSSSPADCAALAAGWVAYPTFRPPVARGASCDAAYQQAD